MLWAVALSHASPRLGGTGQFRPRSLLRLNVRGSSARGANEGVEWAGVMYSSTCIANLLVEGVEGRWGKLFEVVVLYLNFCSQKKIPVFRNPRGYRGTFIFRFRLRKDLSPSASSFFTTQTMKTCYGFSTRRAFFRSSNVLTFIGVISFLFFLL